MKTLALIVLAGLLATPQPPRLTVEGASSSSGANPFGIAFSSIQNVELYARPGGLIVSGRCFPHYSDPQMQAVRTAGGEVLHYFNPNDWPTNGGACDRDRAYFKGYGKPVPLWPYPKSAPGTRSKWARTLMTDMRPGSPWLDYSVKYAASILREGKVDGLFLDTVGARTWAKGADWESWSKEERDAYTLGNLEFVRRLDAERRKINPSLILVNNSIWDRTDAQALSHQGRQYVDGSAIEHPKGISAFHRNYAADKFSGINRRVLIIANTQEEARAWAAVPGVTHVSGQATSQYKHPLAPAVSFKGTR